jgi:hypothetical protein
MSSERYVYLKRYCAGPLIETLRDQGYLPAGTRRKPDEDTDKMKLCWVIFTRHESCAISTGRNPAQGIGPFSRAL